MMPVLTLTVHLLAADPAGYVQPSLLVEAEALAKKDAEAFRVLDVRSLGQYEAGHIPGAVSAPLSKWSKAVTAGTAGAAFWKIELAAVGVAAKQPVVVYAEDVRDACRAWWILKLAGVPDVRVLNGGWAAFQAMGGRVQKDPVTATAKPFDWLTDRRPGCGQGRCFANAEGKEGHDHRHAVRRRIQGWSHSGRGAAGVVGTGR